MSANVRAYILEQITPNLPAGWDVVPGVPTLQTLRKPMLWIEYTGFTPHPDVPLAAIRVNADLCIATHLNDMRKGEDATDEDVLALYEATLIADAFESFTATKTVFADTYIGWRLSTTVVISKDPEE